MAAVQTVGAGGQGTPGGAPGGQMQPGPGPQWGGQPYFVEEEFNSLNNNINHHPAPALFSPFPYTTYVPMPIGSVKKAVINNNR